jgi:hypothetical protein
MNIPRAQPRIPWPPPSDSVLLLAPGCTRLRFLQGVALFAFLYSARTTSLRYRVGPALPGDVVLPFLSFNSRNSSGSSGSETMSLWTSALRFR